MKVVVSWENVSITKPYFSFHFHRSNVSVRSKKNVFQLSLLLVDSLNTKLFAIFAVLFGSHREAVKVVVVKVISVGHDASALDRRQAEC